MTKLNQFPLPLSPTSDVDADTSISWINPEEVHQLIILVPADSDCTSVTRRICSMAKQTNSCVHLLGLYKNTSEELPLRRELVMAAALIRDADVYVDIMLEQGTDWVEAVRHNYRRGDSIVCLTERSIGLRQQPLSQILKSNFDAPVYIFSKGHVQEAKTKVYSPVVAWSGLIAIIVGFFLLQIKITQLTNSGFQTLLLLLLLIPEIRILQVWNSIFF